MSFLNLLGILLAICFMVWIFRMVANYFEAPPKIIQLIYIVAIIAATFYVLTAFGIWNLFRSIQVPSIK